METLRLKRTGLRSSFTKTANVLKKELIKDDIKLGLVKDKFTKLQNLHFKLKELNDQILDLLIEEETLEKEVSNEIESREVYSGEFITLTRQVNEKLQIPDGMSSETRSQDGSNISCHKTKEDKLPKIELKKFDGELFNFLPFWSQFEKIHNDPELHDSDKFSYLVQSMRSGFRANEIIKSYPVTLENYDKAVFALKDRFGENE